MPFEPILTQQDKYDILELFFRTELRIGESIIDNTDKFISEELNLPKKTVSYFIHTFLRKKEKRLNKKINSEFNEVD